MTLRSLIWHRVFQIRCWLVAFGLGIWTGGLALNGGSTGPGAPTLSGQDAVVQVVVDNDYALLAGNLSGPTRLVYQPGDGDWNGQYLSSLDASVKMSLIDGETHLYLVAMGGGGGESFQGKINGIDLTSLSVPQVQTALNSANGYLDISGSLAGFSQSTVSDGVFSLTLAQVQSALQGQSWGAPPSSLSGSLTAITSSAWPFPSDYAVVFRFQASALNLDSLPLPGNQSATLGWLAPSYDGGFAIVDYRVQYSTDVTDEKKWTTFDEGVSAATTAVVTGLINGTAYQFRVAAINVNGVGYYSVASPSVKTIGNYAPTMTFGVSAAGGTKTTADGFIVHTFTGPSEFTPAESGLVEVLLVGGGGGGGGSFAGGGGGGGGVVSSTSYAVNAGEPISVIVGLGGAGGSHSLQGENGGVSQFGSLTALGGGGGGLTPELDLVGTVVPVVELDTPVFRALGRLPKDH